MDPNITPPPAKRESRAAVTIAVAFGVLCCLLMFVVTGWLVAWVIAALALIIGFGFVHHKIWGQKAGSPGWDTNRQNPDLPG